MICDRFHAVKLANAAVDDVRRRVHRETYGRWGRKADPLYRARRLMTRGWERLTERQQTTLLEALAAGDPAGEVGATIIGKELLRLSLAEQEQLVAGYQAGVVVKELAGQFNVHPSTVMAMIRRRELRRRRPVLRAEQVARAVKLYLNGLSLATIGNEFFCQETTVRLALVKAGVKIRPRRGWTY